MAPPALSAQGLSKSYGTVAALTDFSLAVHPGEVVGLLGPNGAGKTTALRMLAGIMSPDAGTVHVDGIAMQDDPIAAKARLGFLTGDTQLYQRLTARELLHWFGELYGLAKTLRQERAQALIDQLDMSGFADRPCKGLSAGQKQRANIARALIHDPAVLILDEPTNALDIISGRFIVETIRARREAGKAILFSTHIMGEAEYLCDRIVMVHRGRVVEQGTQQEIIGRAACHNLTDAFLLAIGEQIQAQGVSA